VEIALTLETRGREHVEELVAGMREMGVSVELDM